MAPTKTLWVLESCPEMIDEEFAEGANLTAALGVRLVAVDYESEDVRKLCCKVQCWWQPSWDYYHRGDIAFSIDY
ncbi:MAG: hypothetical protein Q8K00_17755 [Syntrophales bacterium]|nr:hypothetical protein [Syntrophales bacterium]